MSLRRIVCTVIGIAIALTFAPVGRWFSVRVHQDEALNGTPLRPAFAADKLNACRNACTGDLVCDGYTFVADEGVKSGQCQLIDDVRGRRNMVGAVSGVVDIRRRNQSLLNLIWR